MERGTLGVISGLFRAFQGLRGIFWVSDMKDGHGGTGELGKYGRFQLDKHLTYYFSTHAQERSCSG